MPNSHDLAETARMAAGTTSVDPRTAASTTSGYIQTKNSQILTNDGTTNRLQITPTQMKVSQAGFDVTTATNDQLIFNSSQDVFKIVASGSVSHTGASISAGNTDTVTIAHNLGYFPAFLVYTTAPAFLYNWSGTNTGRTMLPIPYVLTGTTIIYLYARVDSTNLYIDFFNCSSSTQTLTSYTWNFQYYLMQETAASS